MQTLDRSWLERQRNYHSTIRKFWSFVQKTDECWLWTGTLNDKGYGKIVSSGNGVEIRRAHQLSWLIHGGEIAPGMFVCHKCDNPRCVRPDHLFIGTTQDNTRDRHAKGRTAKGEQQGSHVLTESQVEWIRKTYSEHGASQRQLARAVGCTQITIWRVVNRLSWAHVGTP